MFGTNMMRGPTLLKSIIPGLVSNGLVVLQPKFGAKGRRSPSTQFQCRMAKK